MKHKPVKQSSFFKTKAEKLERIRKICDRCGDGTFMADHGNRCYCGKCKLTIWKQKNK